MIFFVIFLKYYFVMLYGSLFNACETISYVVLYLFTVHIRCTEKKFCFYTQCSACLQGLEGLKLREPTFIALVHEHTLTY